MQIISHKNSLTNAVTFLKNAHEKPYIQGLVLDVIMIRDRKIIVYSPDSMESISTEALQGSTIEQLNDSGVRELEAVLVDLQKFSKRLLINVTPLNTPPLSDATIQMINERNRTYVQAVLEIVSHFPRMDISLHSTSRHIVQAMKRERPPRKLGLTILPENLNFLDTDYYLFSPLMLNLDIMTQQLQLGKEVMVSIENCNDLTIAFHYFFLMEPSLAKQNLLRQMIFVSYYPEILFYLFHANGAS